MPAQKNYLKYNLLLITLITPLLILAQASKTDVYKLSKTDIYLLSAGVVTLSASYLINNNSPILTTNDILKFDKYQINTLDRPATYQYNTNLAIFSDITAVALASTPAIIGINRLKKQSFKHALTYGVLCAETYILATAVATITKTTVLRNRPYLYNNNLSIEKKIELAGYKSSRHSFFSGHTCMSFTAATFLSSTFSAYYPNSRYKYVIWGTSLTMASFVGFLRYKSGNHFATDILTGAAVGSIIGIGVPLLHRNKNNLLQFAVMPGYLTIKYAL